MCRQGRTGLGLSNIQKIVDDPAWQALRRSFVGTWKHTPAANVKKLRKYLRTGRTIKYRRFRQVYNYLTGSGFRIGVISHPSIDKLLAEVREIKKSKRW